MRSLSIAIVLAAGLMASVPAVAQVSPGRVYYNSAPGTGAPMPPMISTNQSTIPAPHGMVSANPPHYNQPRPMVSPNPRHFNGMQQRRGGRWGGNVNGRWWAGAQAPGGWGAYRRPTRGFMLPAFWLAADFAILDFDAFGLRAPGSGYSWVRYYDDAVLVDAHGRVFDSVGGIAWADAGAYAEDGYAAADSQAYADTGGGYAPPIAPVDPNQYYGHQGGYAPPPAGPPPVQYRGYSDENVYYGNGGNRGYYAAPGTVTTTVVIQPATTVTTTTVEEVTTYVARRAHVVHRPCRPKPRPKPRPCGCR